MTGKIFMYRHISRWKDMMRLSMQMFSIRGKVMRKLIRVRFRRRFNPVASYVKYFTVPEHMKGKTAVYFFPGSGERTCTMDERKVCRLQ